MEDRTPRILVPGVMEQECAAIAGEPVGAEEHGSGFAVVASLAFWLTGFRSALFLIQDCAKIRNDEEGFGPILEAVAG